MKGRFKRLSVFAAAVFFLALQAVSAAANNPLADRIDAVVVKGKDIPEHMLNGSIPSYRVFADSGAGLNAIPFQIDERGPDGMIHVSKGPYADATDGKFGTFDELVFMARDAGQPPANNKIEGCSKSVEIKIADKKTGATGYVVLAFCENPPALSTRDYVSYDAQHRIVTSSRYGFAWKTGDVYPYDYLSINNGPDLLDRLKVRAAVGKWGINYTFNEDHFRHKFNGYTDGPVRVIWKSYDCWSLGPLGKIAVPQYMYFYEDYALINDAMDARMNPALFGLELDVMISHDLALDQSRGYVFCGNVSPGCENMIKLPEQRIKYLTDQHMDWGGVSGPEGALMTHLVPDKRLNVRVKGIFINDDQYKDPPEYIPGSSPKVGFELVDWKNVKPAVYDLDFYHFFFSKYSPEEFARFDRVITNPLAVTIK